MSSVILSNAFSINMLQISEGEEKTIKIRRITLAEVKELLKNGFTSAVGHASTAELLSQILGVNVSTNRIEIKLQQGQLLVVFQLLFRLPEGQVLTAEQVQQLINQGKVGFYLVQLLS